MSDAYDSLLMNPIEHTYVERLLHTDLRDVVDKSRVDLFKEHIHTHARTICPPSVTYNAYEVGVELAYQSTVPMLRENAVDALVFLKGRRDDERDFLMRSVAFARMLKEHRKDPEVKDLDAEWDAWEAMESLPEGEGRG